jgi:uncharacterized membrane protein
VRRERSATPERIVAFSDGAFALIITLLVLDLHALSTAAIVTLRFPLFAMRIICVSGPFAPRGAPVNLQGGRTQT